MEPQSAANHVRLFLEVKVTRRLLIVATILVVFSIAASAALAKKPPPGYQGTGGAVQTTVESGGSLPFTGMDLGLLIGGGLMMILVGAGLRKLSRVKA